jgi:hypothetical protein
MTEITRPELEQLLFAIGITPTAWQVEMLLRLLHSDEPISLTGPYRRP